MNKFRTLLCLALLPAAVFAQQPKKIEIVYAARVKSGGSDEKPMQRLIGKVQLKHEGMVLKCDSAHLYQQSNTFIGYSNVHLNQGDTLHLYGDRLDYNGNTRTAVMTGNVRLIDPEIQLSTPSLTFDRNTQLGFYTEGADIQTKEQFLSSLTGTYDGNTDRIHFKRNVHLIHPEYTIDTDTMVHHTESEQTWFFGPTHIIGNGGDIHCNKGYFDALNEVSWFADSAVIVNDGKQIEGDSIFYNQRDDMGYVYNNVCITDSAEGYTVQGQYAEYKESGNYAFITGSPLYSINIDGDLLHLAGDTLLSYRAADTAERFLKVYRNVRIYKTDFQARCDSLFYSEADSTFHLYEEPILWNGVNQMTSDNMTLTLKGGSMHSLNMTGNAFIVGEASNNLYDQIKGRDMFGTFADNELSGIDVYGNGQTVFNAYNENDLLMGVNRVDCSNIFIRISDNKFRSITYKVKPDGIFYPVALVPEGEKRLKGFRLRFDERPGFTDLVD